MGVEGGFVMSIRLEDGKNRAMECSHSKSEGNREDILSRNGGRGGGGGGRESGTLEIASIGTRRRNIQKC